MIVDDPGHRYLLNCLDGTPARAPILEFVKRVGSEYPGNTAPAHGGTTIQEVLRALIDRLEYVDAQRPCPETKWVAGALRASLFMLEVRVRRERGQPPLSFGSEGIELRPTCATCGHVACLDHSAPQ
jgi:hypothetical protein